VHAAIISGFRTPDRPTHDGVDLGAVRGTPILAASAGVVILALCNSSIGTCDVDGGIDVQGCGWYVEILHPRNIVTRYCHMGRQPAVRVGQPVQGGQLLGYVGSSGNSSGPHLHFEVHAGNPTNSGNAIAPIPFMTAAGAPLGR
jgi:murein DD-endopeptidase MepM/ murein hydrolase activator NlpD